MVVGCCCTSGVASCGIELAKAGSKKQNSRQQMTIAGKVCLRVFLFMNIYAAYSDFLPHYIPALNNCCPVEVAVVADACFR
jgi:hypothetical protein